MVVTATLNQNCFIIRAIASLRNGTIPIMNKCLMNDSYTNNNMKVMLFEVMFEKYAIFQSECFVNMTH